jgi:DNA (cytosine-5)-methyltransferase 1
MKPQNHIDIELFAGGGGMSVGLKKAGFAPASFYEIDRYCCETLRKNGESGNGTINGSVIESDVRDIDWSHFKSPVRLLAAGAPCQPFSLGGKHSAHRDSRNLFPEVVSAIRNLNPSVILIENVRGLLRQSFRAYFDYIIDQIAFPELIRRKNESWIDHKARLKKALSKRKVSPTYFVSWKLINAADFGVPQNRMRAFIVATRSDLKPYQFPSPTHSKETLLHDQLHGKYWERHGLKKPRNKSTKLIANDMFLLPWRTVRDGLDSLQEPAESEEHSRMNHWKIPGARVYAGHVGSSLDLPSKTIKAGVHGVPGGENTLKLDSGKTRYYTLRETARLQTFPDKHIFFGARSNVTRQIGNAVPCLLAEALAKPLFKLVC